VVNFFEFTHLYKHLKQGKKKKLTVMPRAVFVYRKKLKCGKKKKKNVSKECMEELNLPNPSLYK